MIRLFEFQDLDKIMDIWLQGNLEAHSFIDAEYWKKNFDSVKSVLPNAEVYVYEEDGEILGFHRNGRGIYCRYFCSGRTQGAGNWPSAN